jgi:hypothetical protein
MVVYNLFGYDRFPGLLNELGEKMEKNVKHHSNIIRGEERHSNGERELWRLVNGWIDRECVIISEYEQIAQSSHSSRSLE